jgi:hypothetical protein
MFGGQPAVDRLVSKGYSQQQASNPGFQMAYMMAGGNKDQAEFNHKLFSALGMIPGGAGFEGTESSAPQSQMNPASGLKAAMPGVKAKGGSVKNRKR